MLAGAAATAAPSAAKPTYEIKLDDRRPTRVDFLLHVQPQRELTLSLPKSADQPIAAPACSSTALRQMGPGKWLKPSGCTAISWSASIATIDQASFDASRAVPGWSPHNRLWLLTAALPWLSAPGQVGSAVHITARLSGQILSTMGRAPVHGAIPTAIVVGKPARRYTADGFTVVACGEAPTGPTADRLQRQLASSLAQWWRDIPPRTARHPHHFNFVWFGPGKNSEPGLFASAGSDALLIQYIPDRGAADPNVKLRTGILLTGAHEALHSLFEFVPGAARPVWAAESLPTFFAYQAARRHLSGASLALASEMVSAPAGHALLNAERQVEGGDDSEYGSFYSRGTRFWVAIERVLNIAPNGSGRLAALIQRTNGMEEMDWKNADSIAAFLDRYSGGRAAPIVRCYLVEDSCAAANTPLAD